ncbi:hypothetical protein FSARC_9441 [Fusarium sarcochroum]|uniref:Uncharacterized protein n=1 Tax=Fusarium sarcochroum TaxID=1208366 RepID=A0A8H4TQW5_9HYPO|nr:hypothetical protein FSARC_9441 [Fusarium sarcochroum]
MRSSITLGLLALAPYMADAARSKTEYTTSTVFLPSRSTGSASNIYASIITEDESKTEYLLACQTNFGASYTCGGEFTGITVTYQKSDVDIAFGATTYDCELGTSAVCATKTKSSGDETTTTLAASESSSWMTAITIVDVKKRKPKAKAAAPKETGSSKICKRRLRDHGSDSGGSSGSSSDSGSDSSSDSSKDTSKDSDSDDDSSSGSSSRKNKDNDCSAGSTISWNWGMLGLGLGGYLALNLR